MAEGRSSCVASALGVGTGGLVDVVAATFGLSALFATSALAFAIVKWVGVAYLVYLGVRTLMSHSVTNPQVIPGGVEAGVSAAYRRGILISVLNPKVAIFFLAFLPQFVESGSPHQTLAFMVLGGTFVFTGTVWCLIIAFVSAGHIAEDTPVRFRRESHAPCGRGCICGLWR